MSEVLQLNEMHAVLIASKEDNNRKRQEAQDMMAKIAELEKRLEEGVAFTNRYRATKTAATGGLRKRTEALQDLFLKLDHVAKQTSDVYMSRLSSTAEGVRDHEGVPAQMTLDLAAAFEWLKCLVERHRDCSKQEAKTKSLPSANRSKENEAKELVDRVGELELQCKSKDEDAAIADAARRSAVEAKESLRAERASLEQRLEAAVSNLEQSTREMADTQEDRQTAERAWSGDKALMMREKDSIAVDTQAMRLRLSHLSGDDSLKERLPELEAEQARLAEMGPKLSIELGEIKRQCKQHDPKVLELMAQVQEKTQRRQFLADHLAASRKVLAAHSINTTEFDDRKAEHQELASSIEALRSTQAGAEARKASLGEETRSAMQEAAAATKATKGEIAILNEESVGVAAARNEAAAAATPIQMAAARAQNELAVLKGKSEETATALQHIAGLERDTKNPSCERESDRDRAIAQSQQITLEYQAETESIERAVEVLGEELEAAKARAQEEQQGRMEVAKHQLFTEAMSRKTGAMTAEIEITYVAELKSIQEEIMFEDTRLRVACTEATRCPTGGGVEERLQLELSDLLAQEAAMRSGVNSAESRVERLRENEHGRLEATPR